MERVKSGNDGAGEMEQNQMQQKEMKQNEMSQEERRRWLIQRLLEENPYYRNYRIPEEEQEQKVLRQIHPMGHSGRFPLH